MPMIDKVDFELWLFPLECPEFLILVSYHTFVKENYLLKL